MNFENIHNYYEKLVIDHLQQTLIGRDGIQDQDFLEDIACVALNRLPVHYVRHDVDTAFFMSDEDSNRMKKEVAEAVGSAAEYIARHRGREVS